jgi:non-heme chloroperoxidase
MTPSAASTPPSSGGSERLRRSRRLLVIGGLVGLGVAAGAAYRRLSNGQSGAHDEADSGVDDGRLSLGWGSGAVVAEPQTVVTPDGAQLAVWDYTGDSPDAPVVVLSHCWTGNHEIWVPVARRLREKGYRVVLYDQRGHGASTRGTAPITVELLAHDLADVLEATDVRDAVLAGHSMGGMSIMSLASHRSDLLHERARAVVLVATSATRVGNYPDAVVRRMAAPLVASPAITRAMAGRSGHRFVRGVFGTDPVHAHMVLTADAFSKAHPGARADYMVALSTMDLLEGIATIRLPTTVIVGSRDTLTLPPKSDEMVATIPGARLVTLQDKGHMLPLEDPDAVTDEIVRAVKG